LERRRPFGRRLDDDEPRPFRHRLEREDDLAAVVFPAQRQQPLGLDLLDARAAFLAVAPAERATPAGARVELDLGGEPVLEPLRLRQCLPDLGRLRREDDLAPHVHPLTSWLAQPWGCAMISNREVAR